MRRRRTATAPVVELWIDTVVVDASWLLRGRAQFEAGLRDGLEQELIHPTGEAARDPQRARLVDEVELSCSAPERSTPAGAHAWGSAAGRAIGGDLGSRLSPMPGGVTPMREGRR